MSTDAAARAFFAQPRFAVVGASTNQAKFGYKIFAWYVDHGLPVTPVNPAAPTIAVGRAAHAAVPSLAALPHPRETALSVVTPPAATLAVLREARALGVPAVWLQPGTFDAAVLDFARGGGGGPAASAAFEAVVAGDGGRGSEGWCVLVDGESALRANGKL